MRNLNDLLVWLEYGRTSGYIAARESKEQEEHWADLLKELIAACSLMAEASAKILEDPVVIEGAGLTLADGKHLAAIIRAGVVK